MINFKDFLCFNQHKPLLPFEKQRRVNDNYLNADNCMAKYNLMSRLTASTPEEPQTHPITFKIVLHPQFLILTLIGPSQSFFQCFNLQSHPLMLNVLKDYLITQQSRGKIKFCHVLEYHTSDHSVLQQKLKTLLGEYKLCMITYGPESHEQLQATKKYLIGMSDKVRLQTENNSLQNYCEQLIIYCPIDLASKVEKAVMHFQRYQRLKLVFPLNFLIREEIKRQLHQRFIQQLTITYIQQIKRLPPKNSILKHLTIHSVKPHFVSRQHRSPQWTKEERLGISGLSIDIAGLDYQILKFHSILQQFFSKICYCVQTIQNTPEENEEEAYLRRKYDHKSIRYIPLSKEQVVIIGPPELFSKTKSELNKHFWTISCKQFPNLNFAMIKNKQNAFRRFLKIRKNHWEGMVVSQNSLTFYSDKENFERIQQQTEVFLFQHLKQEFELLFINSQEDLAIFQKFTLEPLKVSLLQDFEIFWQDGRAKCKCSQYLLKNIEQHLKDLYEQYLQTLEEIVAIDNIHDPLAIKESNPTDLVPQKYLQWKLTATDLAFELTVVDQRSCQKQDFAILMVNNINQCPQLNRLIGEQRVGQLKKNRERFSELALSDCRMFRSIVYWNTRRFSHQDYQFQQRRLYHELLSLLCTSNKEVTFIITRQLFGASFPKLELFLENLAYREDHLYKKVKLILSEQLRDQQRQQVINRLIYYFEQKLQQPIQFQSLIPTSFIKQIITLRYFQLRWTFQDSQHKKEEILCSPLNSFIFHSEKQSLRYKAQKFGIILPKIANIIEILVNLVAQQAFYFVGGQLSKVCEQPLLGLIKVVISIIRHYFPQQNYIVLYSNQQKNNLICSIYVFSFNHPQVLRKYKIDRNDHKIKGNCNELVTFKLQQKMKDRYRYRTHVKYMPNLLKKVHD